MAEKRMFSKKITDSDAFLDMPMSTQCLYFHLCMYADDDGFVNNPKKVQRMIGANDDDLKVLISKSFIIPFESGVAVIKHWLIHNTLRKDRYTGTQYLEEKSLLHIMENRAYTVNGNHMATNGIPCDNQRLPQISIDKSSIDKNNKYIDDFFNSVWALLPSHPNDVKKDVKSKRRKELMKFGYDKIKHACEMYLVKTNPQYRHKRNKFFNDLLENYMSMVEERGTYSYGQEYEGEDY